MSDEVTDVPVAEESAAVKPAETVEADAKTEDAVEKAEGSESEEKVSEPSESSTENKEDGEVKAAKKRINEEDVQKRINEITGQRYRETRRADELQAKLDQIEQSNQQPAEPGKTIADFEYDDVAYQDYVKQEVTANMQKALDEQNARIQQSNRQVKFDTQEIAFSETVPDYAETVHSDHYQLDRNLLEAIKGTDDGPATVYHLAKNPEKANEIFKMTPVEALMEIGRIQASGLQPPKPSPSNAPAPAPKIAAVATPTRVNSSDAASDKLSNKAWNARREKELRAKQNG